MHFDKLLDYSLNGTIHVPENEEEAKEWIKFLLEGSIAGGDDNIREMITLKLIGAESVPGKHGWDGKLGSYMIEVKNETMPIDGRLSGAGLFNNVTWKSFKKYEDQKGLYLQAGYTRDGKLMYCIAFDMKHLLPIIEAKLQKTIPDRKENGRDVQVSISAKDFPDEVEVVFFPPVFEHQKYSNNLFKLLTQNWLDRTQLRSSRLAPKSLSFK